MLKRNLQKRKKRLKRRNLASGIVAKTNQMKMAKKSLKRKNLTSGAAAKTNLKMKNPKMNQMKRIRKKNPTSGPGLKRNLPMEGLPEDYSHS